MDFTKQQREHQDCSGKAESFKFLGVHITDKLKWSTHHRKCGEEGRRLKKFGLAPKTLTTCYGNCSARNCRVLQRVVWSAQGITGGKLPAPQDTYST
jgi:hypothetical protein